MKPARLLDVLYVDDDADVREIVSLSLSLDPAIRPRVAGSALEALAMLAERPLPDAVLLDVMMPGMNGPDLVEHIRADPALRTLPVIFLTARTRAHDLLRYRAAGAFATIAKPFDPLQLAAKLRAMLSACLGGAQA